MYVVKGVFKSTTSTLLDISGMTKNGLRARKDLQKIQNKATIAPPRKTEWKVLPNPASYNLTHHFMHEIISK
jgi:hypothetical protein